MHKDLPLVTVMEGALNQESEALIPSLGSDTPKTYKYK